MYFLLFLLLVALLLGAAMWVTVGVIGLMLTLFVAGLIGAGADAIVPGRLPGGWLGAILAGIVGGFVGQLVLGLFGIRSLGPGLFGVHIIPAFVGAVVIAAVAGLLTRRNARSIE